MPIVQTVKALNRKAGSGFRQCVIDPSLCCGSKENYRGKAGSFVTGVPKRRPVPMRNRPLRSPTAQRASLILEANSAFAATNHMLRPTASSLCGVAWRGRTISTPAAISVRVQTLADASFVVSGATQASDSALITASVEKKWLTGWSAAATFEGEFSNVTASYKGVLRYTW
jgi:hypothetical protein